MASREEADAKHREFVQMYQDIEDGGLPTPTDPLPALTLTIWERGVMVEVKQAHMHLGYWRSVAKLAQAS